MASGLKGKVEDTESSSSFRRQGSLRRVLPPFNSVDAVGNPNIVTSSAAKMIDRPVSSNMDNRTEYAAGSQRGVPFGIEQIISYEYIIISEYQMFLKKNIPGMYTIPSAASPYLWFGVLFMRQGPYEGGIFRFQVIIPQTYPSSGIPKIIFEKPIFHPMVDPMTGEFSFNDHDDENEMESKRREFSTRVGFGMSEHWHISKHIWEMLQSVYNVMVNIETENGANREAGKMFKENYEEFCKRAAEVAKQSIEHVHDPTAINDPHYFYFDTYDENIHESYRKQLLSHSATERADSSSSSTVGFSWVQPGTLIPFSKKLSLS
ncbi:hypothetical protein J437_LFUL013275 [Ladona fulva]|uniref:UBC core domain-containing protein n=1 Tax=Ladona fulva TaxID=123851 RepID=A0A8K0KDZ6_LADFU|nr:hypothetical protein J437_LFUL013275 [Ladona fulva]